LLKYYPESATSENDFREIPLHLAVKSNAPAVVLSLLLEACPSSVRHTRKDHSAGLPLHLVPRCRSRTANGDQNALANMKLLYNAFPEAIDRANSMLNAVIGYFPVRRETCAVWEAALHFVMSKKKDAIASEKSGKSSAPLTSATKFVLTKREARNFCLLPLTAWRRILQGSPLERLIHHTSFSSPRPLNDIWRNIESACR
jgi:hypothetical protein